MKKLCLLLLSAVFCFVSCYDDSALQDSVANLEKRVVTLEKLCEEVNTNITSMNEILNAIKDKDYVTGVEKIVENGQEVGYEIKFTKSDPIKIYNGKNGTDGKDGIDGKTPAIGVRKDIDGKYYWTLNGEWMLDEGIKVQASGKDGIDGKDAILPEVKIADGKWYFKFGEGEWQEMGQATGDAFFQDVQVGANDVTITLADGQAFVLPLKAKLAIEFTLPAQPAAGATVEVRYDITGAAGKTQVKTICQNGWAAKVTPITYAAGKIAVTAPDPINNDEIIVLVSDEENHVIMSSISWVENEMVIASVEKVNVDPLEGTFSLSIDANIDYQVAIDQPWLTQVPEVKAMRTDVLEFAYAKNTTITAREAKITLNRVDGSEILSIIVAQEAGKYALEFIHQIGEVTGVAGEYELPLKCESITTWEAKSDADWATVKMEGNKLSVVVTEHSGAKRSASITVTGEADGNKFNDIFFLDQIGVSAVADIVDVEFGDDGKAIDVSAAKTEIYSFFGNELQTKKLEPYGINAAYFSHGYNQYPAASTGTYTMKENLFRPAMENGFSMEALVMCNIEPIGNGKESKAFSSTASGGLALMLNGTKKDLTFLICGDVEPTDKKVWRFIGSGIIPVPGQWYHVIGTWDKATGIARIYVDGKLAKEEQLPANIKMHWSTLGENAYFTIGANSQKGNAEAPVMNNSWEGGVTATRIYSGALAPEQIEAAEINIWKDRIRLSDSE